MASSSPRTPAAPAPDPRDEAFLREVDEAYRQDELARFWQRWGRWLVAAIGAGVLAFGGFLLWQGEQQRQLEARSERFAAAIDKLEGGDSVAAIESFSALEGERGTYATLATLMQAVVATQGGDSERALAAYRAVAANARAPQPLRDVATFKEIRLAFDALPPDEVIARLSPYLEGDSPWAPAAAELVGLAHLKAGNREAAGPFFLRAASDERAPTSLRARTEQMAAALGQDTTRILADLERQARMAAGEEPDAGDAPPPPAPPAPEAGR